MGWLWWLVLAAVVGMTVLIVLAPLRGARVPIGSGQPDSLDQLLQDKAQALRALKDLEHDRTAGLLTEAEFAAARTSYLEKAAMLNRAIQALTGIDVAQAAGVEKTLASSASTQEEGSR